MQLFIILLVTGIIFLSSEVLVPGGILGTIGVIAFIAAITIAFSAFGQKIGILVAVIILLSLAGAVWAWLTLLPKTKMGKGITLQSDGKDFISTGQDYSALLNKSGQALTDLRPAGVAEIDGHRLDVITEGGLVNKGAQVRLISIAGNRFIVREEHNDEDKQS
ncbi:MAG: hypothetical protein GX811_05935 [Lentisphaerae bacterium]|jgi:membrane-bound serine protease (ClpP class)|nr:hypothetical protein [Lentisphaerota bacterium]